MKLPTKMATNSIGFHWCGNYVLAVVRSKLCPTGSVSASLLLAGLHYAVYAGLHYAVYANRAYAHSIVFL